MFTLVSLLLTPDKQVRGNNIFAYMAVIFMLLFIYNDSIRLAYVCFIMTYMCMFGLQPSRSEIDKKHIEQL